MSKHTPGPWHISDNDGAYCIIRGQPHTNYNGESVAKIWLRGVSLKHFHTANAERIVACVNAMEGIDDPAAARAILDDPRTAAATDMLEALKWVEREMFQRDPDKTQMAVVIKNAIEKSRGYK